MACLCDMAFFGDGQRSKWRDTFVPLGFSLKKCEIMFLQQLSLIILPRDRLESNLLTDENVWAIQGKRKPLLENIVCLPFVPSTVNFIIM